MAYVNVKVLPRRTAADKVLRYKAFNIDRKSKYHGYQHALTSMVYNFFDKKISGCAIKSKIMPNQQLVEKLHKSIIRKFEKWIVHSSFIANTWDADLATIQLISKFNKGFRFLLSVIDVYYKYAWAILLRNTKVTTIINVFQRL